MGASGQSALSICHDLLNHLVVLKTDPRSDEELLQEFHWRLQPIRELPRRTTFAKGLGDCPFPPFP